MVLTEACDDDDDDKNKEEEKVENYQDLKREIGRMWNCHETLGLWGLFLRGFLKVLRLQK